MTVKMEVGFAVSLRTIFTVFLLYGIKCEIQCFIPASNNKQLLNMTLALQTFYICVIRFQENRLY
jgi:hypothetical protein